MKPKPSQLTDLEKILKETELLKAENRELKKLLAVANQSAGIQNSLPEFPASDYETAQQSSFELVADSSGNFMYASNSILQLTGLSPEALLSGGLSAYIDSLNVSTLLSACSETSFEKSGSKTVEINLSMPAAGSILTAFTIIRLKSVSTQADWFYFHITPKTPFLPENDPATTQDAIAVSNFEGMLTHVSYKVVELIEIATNELPPEMYLGNLLQVGTNLQPIIQAIRMIKEWNGQFNINTSGGLQKNIKISASIVGDNSQSATGSVLFRLAENSTKSEEVSGENLNEFTYQDLFDNVTDAIYIQDLNGNFLDVNKGALRMYGHPREKFIGNNPLFVSAPDKNDFDQLLLRLHKAYNGEPQQFEFWGLRANGQEFPKEVRMINGNYFGKKAILVMAQDITHRKETEKALIESEKKYRDLIEFAVDGILIGDADGNIVGANSCMQKLTGRALEQLIGLNVRNLFSDETLAGTPLRYDLLNKGETVTCERELLRLDGTTVPIEMHTKKMPDGTYQSFYRDITERLKAEESLRQSELKFKSLVESTSDMIWETNIQGKYTYVSPQFEKLLGYKPEEVVGTSPFSYIRNDNMPAIINQSDAIVAQGVAFSSLVNKYIHQDGSILYFETSGVPVTDVHGKLCGYRGISRDITKRYKAEIELHKLSWIVQQSPISILLTDLDGNIEYANDAVSHTSGYSLEEIYGKNPSIFKSNQTSESDYKVLWENLLAGNKWAGTFLSKRKDGSLYWESAVIQPVRDANGIITNYLGIKEDITKRVNAEHALTESEKRYRGLFEASPDAILLADTETGMLIDANSTACLMLGYSHEQIRTLHQSQVHPERLHLESRQLFKTHTQKPSIQTPTESIIVKSDGTEIPVEILSSINVIDGRNVLMGVFRDITERNQAREDILRAKEKAEASDKLKSAFLNNISHELRTPLNGIIGFSEMITQMDSTEEDKVEFSKMIRKSSVRLINTITSYMDISMLASGIVETISRKVNLKKLINRVYEQTVETSQLRNQPVKINTEGNTAGVEIISDENLLFKVLTYLVDNALKFTKEGSITIGYERIDNNHHFSVTDTGIGIAPESLSLIFDIFTQADISTSRGYEGSGLGLSIAKGFIERLGGKIYVKSAPGLGSTFWFTIPDQIDSKAVASISNLKHNESGANKNIILVAEDDDSNYKYIEIILKKASYKVLRATNGFETVETCRSHPEISLLITDLKMPGMDGFEATRKIRQLRPELPIVVISAFASKSDEEAACYAGCNEYIVKPVTKSKLLDTLQSFLKED